MSEKTRIFISHSHDDKRVADALAGLIRNTFDAAVELRYSSSDDNGEGIAPGEHWLDWILDQVKVSAINLIVLTPHSLQKPWVLWESGAVAGAGLMSGDKSRVVPVAFKISMEQIPSPLRSLQAMYGNDNKSILKLLDKIRSNINNDTFKDDKYYDFRVKSSLDTYISSINSALAERPMVLTEGATLDWLARLDRFEKEDRASEIEHIHKALEIAYIPSDIATGEKLLDIRLHRKLGEIYQKANKHRKAIEQFELALKESPRDIYILHKKALSHLGAVDLPGAEKTLHQILSLDDQLVKENAEIGGLTGRIYRKKWEETDNLDDLRKARDANATVAKFRPESYWMYDTVGQYSLLLDEETVAHEAFGAALNVLTNLNEDNVWTRATKASALLGLGRDEEGIKALEYLSEIIASQQERDSINGGLKRIGKGRNLNETVYTNWMKIISG